MGSGVCMGYNVKCWATSLANCKNTCAKTAGCKMAEYSTSGTCCTSKYDSKKNCPGSFTASKTWSGYFVCAGSTVKTTPKKTGGCGKESAGVCMGYNIKCFSSTLANCKAQCKIQKVAKWPNTPRALKLAARPNTTAKKIVPAASPSRLLGRATPFARGNQRVQSERPSLSEAKLLAVRCQKEFAWDTTSNVSHQPWPTARHNAKRQKIAKRPNTRLVALAARPNTRANLIVLVASRRRRLGRVTAFARDRPDPEAEAAANAARKQAEFAWATTSNVGQQAWPTARQHAPRQKDAKWPNTRPVAPAARPNLTAKKIVLAVSRRRRVGVVTSFVLVRPRKRPITPTTIATRNQKEFAWVTTSNVSHQPLPTARQHALGQQDAKWPNTPRALKLAARPNTTAKKNCPGSFTSSASWKGYRVCKASSGSGKCGKQSPGVCMGYNIKCFSSTLANCKAQCKKTKDCKTAEYSTGGTCCTSKYSSKSDCPGSFEASKTWKGYRVCKGSSGSGSGSGGKCGTKASGVCMGYNIKCWATSLANCKATCGRTKGCKMAEYSTGGTCCTSKFDSKKNCPGSFTASKSWSGYFVCAGSAPKTTHHANHHCNAQSKGVCMGYNLKCFSSTLTNCKATCARTAGCKMAEYAAGSKTCCTSKYDSKKKLSWQLHFVG